jgi:hypothetical protein
LNNIYRKIAVLASCWLLFTANEIRAREIAYDQYGRVSAIFYNQNTDSSISYDDSGNITKVKTQVPLTPPISVSWNVTPAVGEVGENFAFKTRWVHDSPFIVHARFRYRVQGSVEWQTSVMGYETYSGRER